MAMKSNMEAVIEGLVQITAMDQNATTVLDLLSNFFHRHKQCDKSLSLPSRTIATATTWWGGEVR